MIPRLKTEGYSLDGIRIYPMDSGPAPAAEQKATTELPEWAKSYGKDILAKGQALTDVNQNPYEKYTKPRIAGFSPMQQQAMQGAQNMTVTPQTGEATAGATMAGLGGMGVAGQANPYGFQNQVGGYMNPYLQMSLAPQLAEANRQYDIGATKQQSAATQAGAFGGSREAIMAAENERNRNMGLNSIIGQGYNNAFNQAQNQYNQNNQTQLAGYGLMNTAAANLGQLGQNQYGQEMGINQLQNQYGTAQQNLAQTGLNNAYQDFQNEKNYPYKQLGFMSDMIRGLPLGQQSTSQIYQAPPNTLGQIAGLGMGAYGLSQLGGFGDNRKAEGGEVKSYAGGGNIPDPMNDPYEMASAVDKLTDEQLQGILRNPSSPAEFRAAQDELAMRASEQRGVASGITPDMANRLAGGGIVAFAKGGDEGELVVDPMGNVISGDSASGKDFSFNEKNRLALEKAERAIQESKRPAVTASEPYNAITATRRVDFETPVKTAPAPRVGGGTTRPTGQGAGSTASKELSFIDDLRTAQEFLKDPESEARAKKVEASIEALKKQPDEIRKQGLANLLTVGGFGMAQAASQPGAQRGLAGVIQSASRAGPGVAQAAMDQQKLMRASQENAAKLDIEYQKYRIAESKGDKQAMVSTASNIRMMRQQQMQLDEAKRHNQATEGIQGQSLSLQQKKLDAAADNHSRYTMQTKANLISKAQAQASKDWSDLMKQKELKKQFPTQSDYAKYLYEQSWAEAMPQLNYMGTLGKE